MLLITEKKQIEELLNKTLTEVLSEKLPVLIRQMYTKPIYTNDEVSELLKVSKRHLQYLRDTEQLSYVQNGRKIYYRAEDLEQFFNSNQINGR